MPVPTTNLYELWPCNEGAGGIAYGAVHGTAMTLRRTSPWDYTGTGLMGEAQIGDDLPAESGWDVESSPPGSMAFDSGLTIYNGNGVAVIPAGVLALDDVGDGFTLVVRWTPVWVKADGPPFTSVSAATSDVCGASGRYAANPAVSSGVGIVDLNNTSGVAAITQYGSIGAGLPQSVPTDAMTIAAPVAVALVVERVAGLDAPNDCEVRGYFDGELVGTLEAQSSHIDLERICFGSLLGGTRGAFRSAALFTVALDGDEVPEDVDEIDEIEPPEAPEGGEGSPNPWLNEDGSIRLNIPWPQAEHALRMGTHIASEGESGRQTRQVHEGNRRRYQIAWPEHVADGDTLAIIREGLEVMKGGAVSTRWRHPVDDPPGTVASAPRWRLISASGVERSRGGNLGGVTIVIEEV